MNIFFRELCTKYNVLFICDEVKSFLYKKKKILLKILKLLSYFCLGSDRAVQNWKDASLWLGGSQEKTTFFAESILSLFKKFLGWFLNFRDKHSKDK